MKKIYAFISALAVSASCAMPFNAGADPEEDYLPVMYLEIENNDKISVLPDGTVYINSSELSDDDSFRVNIYFRDDSKSCWYVAPKVKCSDMNMKLKSATDPESVYSSPYDFSATLDEECNTVNITIQRPMLAVGTKLTPKSDSTDDSPIAYFDTSVNSSIPAGEYRIYFLAEPEDYPEQRTSTASFLYDDGSSNSVLPELKDQNIVVSDRMFGDVNADGSIDAVDATEVLVEYASLSTDGISTFTESQRIAGNTDSDKSINAIDATAISSYYAYMATTGTLSFAEYLATEFKN